MAVEGPEGGKKEKGKSADRSAHNVIEKKYRTNLRDKIAELRSAVPSLHNTSEDGAEDGEDSATQSKQTRTSKVSYPRTNHHVRLKRAKLTYLPPGNRLHQGDRVYSAAGEPQQGDHQGAPGLVEATAGV